MNPQDFNTDDTNDPAITQGRLTAAQAFCQMLLKAYDALLHYGVNYRETPAYKDQTLLDEAEKLTPQRGFERHITWLGKVESDIAAHVRRKALRLLNKGEPGHE